MQENRSSSNYIRTYPTDQNAVDIFKGEWSSKFPSSFHLSTGGPADLFEDQRITWAESQGVEFSGKRILELGPLEAAHTWMMDQRNAKEIISIEAHERAFLKCLIVKEIAQISSARFIHGNFDEYLQNNQQTFDICLASGVLYHSANPVRLLDDICECSNLIILWTHYYDKEAILTHCPELLARFDDSTTNIHQGIKVNQHPFCYQEEASKDAFCGGLELSSHWLERKGIEAVLSNNGFKTTSIGFDHPHHPNGPALALISRKSC